jgi:hypothetical protein
MLVLKYRIEFWYANLQEKIDIKHKKGQTRKVINFEILKKTKVEIKKKAQYWKEM